MKEKSYIPKTMMLTREQVERKWFLLDANGKTLGRFASEAAKILRGKHKPTFTPHADLGDGIIIVNAEKIAVTGKKRARKIYRYYTGYMSGLREVPFANMLARKPEYILEHAIKKMMPRTKLGRAQLKRLRIFAGEQHNMTAQQPIAANI